MFKEILVGASALALTACAELPRSRYETDGGGAGDRGVREAGVDGALDEHACPPAAALRAHILGRLNELRAGRWLQALDALAADACLDEVGARALAEWTAGGAPHGMFERECLARIPECECDWQQENVGWSRTPAGWKRAVDETLAQMMAEEFTDGGHFRNIVSPRWQRAGIATSCEDAGAGMLRVHLAMEFGP